jgi:hypothetical protein
VVDIVPESCTEYSTERGWKELSTNLGGGLVWWFAAPPLYTSPDGVLRLDPINHAQVDD